MRSVGILMIIMFILVVVSSVPAVAANDSLYIYTIHNYGNLVVATINRSALTYLGDGYWLLILPDMDAVTFSSKLVEEIIDRFIGSRPLYSRIRVVMTNDGYRVVKKFSALNTSEIPSTKVVEVILQALNASSTREASISFLEGNVIRIDVIVQNKLNVKKLVEELLGIAKNHRIIVIETLGFGLPSYFEAQDLYENLRKIPCFISAGESLYGINIWLNITCIKSSAKATNKSFNETLRDIINSIKAQSSLIRKYLPYQDILVVVAQPPSPSIDLPSRIKPVKEIHPTKTTSALPKTASGKGSIANKHTVIIGKQISSSIPIINNIINTEHRKELLMVLSIVASLITAIVVVAIAVVTRKLR